MSVRTYLFHGQRTASLNRPTVQDSVFTNRNPKPENPINKKKEPISDLSKWDPQLIRYTAKSSLDKPVIPVRPSNVLSPIGRFTIDAIQKNGSRWGPEVVQELKKLRRLTDNHVTEVLKVLTDPWVASKLFLWASKQKGFRHDYQTFNAFIHCLGRTNQYRSADEIPDLMVAHGRQPTEKQFDILIRMHATENRGLRVYYVYQMMKRFNVKPQLLLYNRVMDALVKTNHLDLAMSVYKEFKEADMAEDNLTFLILIKGLCNAGRVDEMLELLGNMKAKMLKPDVFAYTTMIKMSLDGGFLDAALKVWSEMRKDDVCPDVVAYATMISGLCEKKRVDEGFAFFKEMKEMGILIDRKIYGTVIEAFVSVGRLGAACDMFRDFVGSGYIPDLGIYGSLIRGLCSAGRVEKAHEIFRKAAVDGLSPGLETANPILMVYAESLEMNEFRIMVAEIERSSENVDLSKFFELLVEKRERVGIALQVFEGLKSRGYKCSIKVYDILMDSLNKVGMVKESWSLLNDIKKTEGLKLTPSIFSIAIESFVADGKIKEAWLCYGEIIKIGGLPTVSSYLTLARGLCDVREIDEALKLVRDCLGKVESGPAEFKYALTILHKCRSRRSDDARSDDVINVMTEMVGEGYLLDSVVCSAVVSGMCKHGTVLVARKIFKALFEKGFLNEAQSNMYRNLILDYKVKKCKDSGALGSKIFGLENKLNADALSSSFQSDTNEK